MDSLEAVESAIDAAQRDYGERRDVGAFISALDRYGWSGGSLDGAAQALERGTYAYGNCVDAGQVMSSLEDSGWVFSE